MFEVRIDSDLDEAVSWIDSIMAGMHEDALDEVAGEAATEVVRDHFYDLAASRHRGNQPQNFWANAAEAANWQRDQNGVAVVVDQVGVAQRRYGGVIEPVNSSHLWIPVHPDSEGKTPGDFIEDLVTIISPVTNKGVAIHEDWEEVYFALVEEVDQPPDPTVSPDPDTLLRSVRDAQLEYIHEVQRGNG